RSGLGDRFRGCRGGSGPLEKPRPGRLKPADQQGKRHAERAIDTAPHLLLQEGLRNDVRSLKRESAATRGNSTSALAACSRCDRRRVSVESALSRPYAPRAAKRHHFVPNCLLTGFAR